MPLALPPCRIHAFTSVPRYSSLRSGKHQPVFAGTYFNTALYNANPNRDADKDGIACEKR